MMLRNRTGLLVFILVFFSLAAWAQRGEGPLRETPPANVSPQEIINRFAAKEKEFAEAREKHYTYRETAKIMTVDGDTVDGEYQQTWDITFDNTGRRYTNVVYAPASTLTRVSMTKEDLDDVQNVMPFVLTTDEIPDYNIQYVGQQHVDELDTYVFDVSPRHIDKRRRYFDGRIWVDSQDLQIVKTDGKSVPDLRSGSGENLFPRFTTYRQQIDGQYWFPTYTYADDNLHFRSGDVHIRIILRYTNYKRFGSDVKITYDGHTVQPGDAQTGDAQPGAAPSSAPRSQPGTVQPPQQ